MGRYYLIQDPYHPYAATFIDVIYRSWGHRAICLYTDEKNRFYASGEYPILDSECVAASVELVGADLERVARRLSRRYELAGIVPYSELTVAHAAELSAHLKLEGSSPETLRRFRDKFALKAWLRERCPALRLNLARKVASPADVLSGPLPERYVLKPNDGYGNTEVAMFDAGGDAGRVEAFFARHPPRNWLLEEFIGGTEYFVNGQVGAPGEVDVLAVFQYERAPANGRENLDHLTWRVPRSAPEFQLLERYARDVVAATGLARSPFHLEAKIDDAGPCLIEVGARLAGNGNAYVCNTLHGGQLDLFHLAAHHYLSREGYGPLPLDWQRYDASELVYVHGVATEATLIEKVHGVADVERLPEFAGWVKKPAAGAEVTPTAGLLTSPWCVLLRGASRARLREASEQVRELIGWNRDAGTVTRVFALGRGLKERLTRRLGWELYGRPRAQLRRLVAADDLP